MADALPTQTMTIDTSGLPQEAEAFNRGFSSLYRYVQHLCDSRAGIHLPEGKKDLVRSRLSKRIRALRLSGFKEYLEVLRASGPNGEERRALEALTTNLTYFFREARHFAVLAERAPEWCVGGGRFWSAGCSSGEEPYTMAMTLSETLGGGRDLSSSRILATDLSTEMVARVREARYGMARLKDVPRDVARRHFIRDPRSDEVLVDPAIRGLVTPARLNLMGPWPMGGKFNAIFCRNVMIYFTGPTRQTLIRRYHDALEPNGLLFVGLSESLNSLDVPFRYLEPGVYAPI